MTSSSALGTPPCTGMSPIAVRIVTVASSPSRMPSSTRSRSASSATNAGRGGAASCVRRRASKASVMTASFSFQVDTAVRRPRSNQQRLGGVGRAPQQLRHLGHGQSVDVPESEREPVVRAEGGEHLVGAQLIEAHVPGILVGHGILFERVPQALFPGAPTPVVGELVAGDADHPRDVERSGSAILEIADGGEERLRGEVLGGGRVAAAIKEVPVHLGHGFLVEGEERGAIGLAPSGPLTHGRLRPFAHDPIIAPSRRFPTGSTRFPCLRRFPYNLRSRTARTEWSGAFSRISRARSRVGRMFSCRFTPLIDRQMLRATWIASSSDSAAKWWKNERSSANAVSRRVRNRSRYHCSMSASSAST